MFVPTIWCSGTDDVSDRPLRRDERNASRQRRASWAPSSGGVGSSEISSQQIADILFSPDQASTDSALGMDASSTSSDVLSQLLAALDAKQS